jgi:predicted transcriptional regulator YheO
VQAGLQKGGFVAAFGFGDVRNSAAHHARADDGFYKCRKRNFGIKNMFGAVIHVLCIDKNSDTLVWALDHHKDFVVANVRKKLY